MAPFYKEFTDYLQKFVALSPGSMGDFASRCKLQSYPKGHELVRAGEVCNHIYFIKSGLGKVFYRKEDKEIIDWIGDEGNVISSIVSFLSRKPGVHIVKLLEPSELVGIHYNDLEQLYRLHHDIERVGRLLTTKALIEMQERVNSMQFETARQRYENFLTRYPGCINRISLGDLASYLGMTQVTLSRIRSQK